MGKLSMNGKWRLIRCRMGRTWGNARETDPVSNSVRTFSAGLGGPLGAGNAQSVPQQVLQPLGFNGPSGNGMVPMVPVNQGGMNQASSMINMGNQGGAGAGPGGINCV